MKAEDLKLPKWLKLVKNDLGIGQGDGGDGDPDDVTLLLDGAIGFDKDTQTGNSAEHFGRVLGNLKDHRVHLLINSLGGRVDQGVAMCNHVAAHGNVHTYNIGYAASAGALVHQAGAHRVMMPGSMLMIHPVHGGLNVEGDADDIEKQTEQYVKVLRASNESIVNMLADRTGNSKKAIRDMMDDTTAMGPDEAKQHGFCDEVGDVSPSWNELGFTPYNLSDPVYFAFKNFRGPKEIRNSGGAVGENNQNKESKTTVMKILIAALASAGLLPSADMTDETAIVNAFRTQNDSVVKSRTSAEGELETLRNRVKEFEAAQKTRITNLVNKAVEDKLVKEARRDNLVQTGLRNEAELDDILNDLREAKGQATTQARPIVNRGAPPVPPTPAGGSESNDDKITALQESLKNASPAEKTVICRQLRNLRGHESIFAKPAAKN